VFLDNKLPGRHGVKEAALLSYCLRISYSEISVLRTIPGWILYQQWAVADSRNMKSLSRG